LVPDSEAAECLSSSPEGPGLPRGSQSVSYFDSPRGPSVNIMQLTIDYSWQNNATCSTMDLNDFFLGHGKKYSKAVSDACTSCPVNKECLDHALKYEEYGFWANTTPQRRVKMRKELGIKVESITYESQKAADKDAAKIEETRVKIRGRGRKPRNLQEQL